MTWAVILKVLESGQVERFSLEGDRVRIGRDPERNDIAVDHPRISKVHAVLSRKGSATYLADCGSRNGVFLEIGGGTVRVEEEQRLPTPGFFSLGREARIWVDFDHPEQETVLNPEAAETQESETIIPDLEKLARVESILILDQCDATGQSSRNEQVAYALKTRLEQISSPILERFRVRFVKNTGDGFLATFSQPVDACCAAVLIAEKIAKRNAKTHNERLHFRIALHHGTTYPIGIGGQDIHGSDVNFTFRLEGLQSRKSEMIETTRAIPQRDRILCSQRFVEAMTKAELPEGISLLGLGRARFQGVPGEHPVYRLVEGSSSLPQGEDG